MLKRLNCGLYYWGLLVSDKMTANDVSMHFPFSVSEVLIIIRLKRGKAKEAKALVLHCPG